LGLKTSSELGGSRLTTTLAVFRQDGSDVQKQRSASFDTNGDGIPDTVLTIVDNTAEQRNTGGEFEVGLASERFGLNAFYSYTDVKIERGATVATIGLPEIAQRGFPKHQAGLTGNLGLALPDNSELNFNANVTYRSEIFLDDYELQGRQGGYSLLNLRLEWNGIAGTGLNAALVGTNVTDKQYRVGVLGLIGEGLGFQSSVYGEPRMYGVELGYKF
jgi:iron complex outermembrane recepter protein